ncbi:MAG: hypothetical protein AB7O74_06955 [Candidatus Nanopelagicales bacterium]
MVDETGSEQPRQRVDGHPTACAILARRWVEEGTIPSHAEGYAAALLSGRVDLALRDVVAVCNGGTVPGFRFPPELRPSRGAGGAVDDRDPA